MGSEPVIAELPALNPPNASSKVGKNEPHADRKAKSPTHRATGSKAKSPANGIQEVASISKKRLISTAPAQAKMDRAALTISARM